MRRSLRSGTLILLIVALAGFLGDAAAVQVRLRRGTAFREVQVNHFLSTPLKGQKEEYDLTGQVAVTCVRAIFPQLGSKPCWWVERHRSQWD